MNIPLLEDHLLENGAASASLDVCHGNRSGHAADEANDSAGPGREGKVVARPFRDVSRDRPHASAELDLPLRPDVLSALVAE